MASRASLMSASVWVVDEVQNPPLTRATPSLMACMATSAASWGNTSASFMFGTMYSGFDPLLHIGKFGEGMGRGDGHLVDIAGTNHEFAFEDPGKPDRIIHLVREVAAARCDHICARFLGRVRIDLGNGVCTGECDGLGVRGVDARLLVVSGPGVEGEMRTSPAFDRLLDCIDPLGVGRFADLPLAVESLSALISLRPMCSPPVVSNTIIFAGSAPAFRMSGRSWYLKLRLRATRCGPP